MVWIGVKNPSAISTLDVDADLDLGAFALLANHIQESTASHNVVFDNTPELLALTSVSGSDVLKADVISSVYGTTSLSYQIAGTITIPASYIAGSVFNVKIGYYAQSGRQMYARVYINGAATGTEKNTTNGTEVTWEEDFTLNPGDVITLRVHTTTDNTWNAYGSCLEVQGDAAGVIEIPTTTW